MRRVLPMALLWTGVSLVALAFGSVDLSLSEILAALCSRIPFLRQWAGEAPTTDVAILMQIRLPRVLLAGVVGAALALAGTGLQGLFRNPMASPYVLGISAGAALGAVIALIWSVQLTVPFFSPVPFFAFGGAVASTLIVYSLARVHGRVPVATLLLAGVALGSFLSAVVSMILVFSQADDQIAGVVFWLMGGLSVADWRGLGFVIPYFIAGTALMFYHSRELNTLLLGEEASLNLGVDVERVKRRLLFATSLLTAAAVAVTGIIGFVGLIVPHIVRLIVGPDHRLLIPLSALSGAILLTVMDTLARSVLPSQEIPVGVISALLGGPFFLALLRRYKSSLY